jgi:hypothetical protein
MENKVIAVGRADCHFCEMLFYELVEIHKLDPYFIVDSVEPELFKDFKNHFGINRFPAVQVDNGTDFITIHMDKDYPDTPNYILVNNLGEMIDKTLELISE